MSAARLHQNPNTNPNPCEGVSPLPVTQPVTWWGVGGECGEAELTARSPAAVTVAPSLRLRGVCGCGRGAAIHVSGGLTRQQALDVDSAELCSELFGDHGLPEVDPLALEMDALHAALMTLPLAEVLGIDDKFLPSYLRAGAATKGVGR